MDTREDDVRGVPDRSGWRAEPALLLALAAAVAVRLAWLYLEPRCELAGDEPTWIALGREIARRPRPLRNALVFYPPVYPYFLALAARLLGSFEAARVLQALVGALLVPAVWSAGRRAHGPRAGVLAAWIAALYPELVWFSVHFWSETLFLVLLWWGIERLIRADAARTIGLAAAAGALWGLAALTREVALLLAPVAVIWALRRGRAGWRVASGFALALALTIAPWTIRNAIVFRAFVPISTMGAENFWVGNTRELTPPEVSAALQEAGGPVEQDRLARARALEAIRQRQPSWIVEKLGSEMPAFWAAGSEILDHLEARLTCGALSARATRAARTIVVGPYLLLLPCFVAGLCLLRPSAPAALMLAVLAADNLVHVAAFATPRFRLPVLPAVFVVAAGVIAQWREGRLPALDARRVAGLVLVSAVTLAILWPSLAELAL